jgi:hypothetical protein
MTHGKSGGWNFLMMFNNPLSAISKYKDIPDGLHKYGNYNR